MLTFGDKVGIIACSDGLAIDYSEKLDGLLEELHKLGLETKLAKTLFQKNGPFSGTPIMRANELMKLYEDSEIKAIFDISGGDSANQVLEYLDYEIIKNNSKPYVGISDLTVILNALNHCAETCSFHYTIRNLIGGDSINQIENFKKSFMENKIDLYNFDYKWISGESMKGIVIGGNIRCFLKLAGTRYSPDPKGKILFLESLGGGPNRIASMFSQLRQMEYLNQIEGIILGTFTVLECNKLRPNIESLVKDLTKEFNIPIIKTSELGHGENAKCIVIGKVLSFEKQGNSNS